MHWLLQETKYHNDNNVAQRLHYLLMEMGHPVTTFKYIPFGGTDYSFMPTEPPLIFFGTCNVVKDIRTRNIPVPPPFVWCDWDLFSCHTYYDKLAAYIVQDAPKFVKLRDLDESVFVKPEMFFRPDDNEKSFVGTPLKRDLFAPWKRDLLSHQDYHQSSEDITVVVAPIKEIAFEWRVVIVDGKAVAGSRYKKHGWLDIEADFPVEVATFAEEVAACWSPHPVFIIDVGLCDGKYRVVEIGPFNYAGLYQCDLRAIVDAISSLEDA